MYPGVCSLTQRSPELLSCISFKVTVCVFAAEHQTTEYRQTVFPLSCHYPSRNTPYLQLKCIRSLQCTGFGVHMRWVLLNHPDFTSAGVPWKACQILGEHISSACYMVWHQMYSRTTEQAQTGPGSRTVRLLINILTASCWLLSLFLALDRLLLPLLSLLLFASNGEPFDGLTAPFLTRRTVTILARQCFEYSGDISMCLEVIRPDFSLCEKSNTSKGQKNNKRLQSLAAWHSILTNSPSSVWTTFIMFPENSKAQKNPKNHLNVFKRNNSSLCKLWLIHCVCDSVGEHMGCVRLLRTRAGWGLRRGGSASASAAPSGPSPGQWWGSWGRHTQTAGRHHRVPYPHEILAAIQPLKCYFF